MKSTTRTEVGIKGTLKLACLGVAMLCASPVWANLIQNGSFEESTVPAVPVGGFTNFVGGSTAIPGWTVVGVDSALVSGTFMQSGITFQAKAGVQWADLAGVTSNSMTSGLSQDVATIAGQLYDLSFNVGSASDTSGQLFFATKVDLSIDGGTRTSYANPTAPHDMLDWEFFTVQFTATSNLTNLTFFNGAAPNNFSTAFDDVSLTAHTSAAPEPGSVALVGLGLAGLFGVRRKLDKATAKQPARAAMRDLAIS